MPLVGWILVFAAAFTIIGMMFMVMREHHEPEEWYQQGQPQTNPPVVTPVAPAPTPAKPEEPPAE
jgi:hypothetical protein